MTLLKDEFLVAYADDELCAKHRRRISLALADDEGAIDTVVKFKITAEYARQAVCWPAPAPERSNAELLHTSCNSVCCDVERVLPMRPRAEPKSTRVRVQILKSRGSVIKDHRQRDRRSTGDDNE